MFKTECDPKSDGEPSGWMDDDVTSDVVDTGINELFLAGHFTTDFPTSVSDERWDEILNVGFRFRVEISVVEEERFESNPSKIVAILAVE